MDLLLSIKDLFTLKRLNQILCESKTSTRIKFKEKSEKLEVKVRVQIFAGFLEFNDR